MSNGIQEQEFDQKVDLNIWKRIIRYAMRYKRLVIALILTMLVVSGADIIYPLLSKYAIDNFVTAQSIDGLGWFMAVYLVVVAIQGVCVYLFVAGASKLEMNISYDIRQDAFIKLQKLPFSFYDRTPVGYLMARMVSDIARLSEMIAWSIVDLFWALSYIIGVMVVLLSLNWRLALLVLVVVPPLALLCLIFQRRILKHQRVVRKTNSRITSGFNEGIMGAMTTKTLVREKQNYDEFTQITGEMKRSSIKSAVLSYIFMPLVMMLGSIGTAIALYKGGQAVLLNNIGEATIFGVIGFGTLSAFISYTMQFFDPIQSLARILAEFQSAQASAERVISLIDTPCDIEDSPEVEEKYGDSFDPKPENWEPIAGDIRFDHVSFAYKEGERVLNDFNLHVKSGQTIALVGETGAGKSTMAERTPLLKRYGAPREWFTQRALYSSRRTVMTPK